MKTDTVQEISTHGHMFVRRNAIRSAIWLRGWDSVLDSRPCPYTRNDYRGLWQSGRQASQDLKPLPARYQWPNKAPRVWP